MAWVRFLRRYIYTPTEDRRISIAYPAGFKGLVRAECAARAIAAGAAEPAPRPTRSSHSRPRPRIPGPGSGR